jgi:hypothetical protein
MYILNEVTPASTTSARSGGRSMQVRESVAVMRSPAHPQGVFVYRVNFQGRSMVMAKSEVAVWTSVGRTASKASSPSCSSGF